MDKEKLIGLDKTLNKLMPLITPLGVVLALIGERYFSPLKPIVNPLFGLMTFFGAMKISLKDMMDALKKPVFLIAFALSSYIILPLFAQLISLLCFQGDGGMTAGFVLLRVIPTAVVGSIWSGIYGGNLAVSLSLLLLDTALAPIMTPTLLRLFSGASVQVDCVGMMVSLLYMVVLPFALGLVFNHFFSKAIKEHLAPVTNPLSKVILLFVIVINVSQVSARIIEGAEWSYLLISLVALVLALVGFPVGYYLCRAFRLNREESVATTFAIAMRNISASLVLAISFLPPSSALPVIFSVLFQQTSAAIMGNRYFGREKEAKEKG